MASSQSSINTCWMNNERSKTKDNFRKSISETVLWSMAKPPWTHLTSSEIVLCYRENQALKKKKEFKNTQSILLSTNHIISYKDLKWWFHFSSLKSNTSNTNILNGGLTIKGLHTKFLSHTSDVVFGFWLQIKQRILTTVVAILSFQLENNTYH